MQTAVEFLEKICNDRGYHLMEEYFKQAKEMEKQQIKDAYKMGRYENDKIVMSETFYAEQYYNETYGSKGSDEHIVDTTEMITKIMYTHEDVLAMMDTFHTSIFNRDLCMNKLTPIKITSSQTEISDEEIEMAALHNEPRVTRRAFKSGAKWYREQFKNK